MFGDCGHEYVPFEDDRYTQLVKGSLGLTPSCPAVCNSQRRSILSISFPRHLPLASPSAVCCPAQVFILPSPSAQRCRTVLFSSSQIQQHSKHQKTPGHAPGRSDFSRRYCCMAWAHAVDEYPGSGPGSWDGKKTREPGSQDSRDPAV